MGVVWRAVDERLERVVALKQILTQPGLSETERINVRQRAMREARNAARLQHPNAIVVFDIAEHEGDPCLVMEYLPSRSLSAILTERPTLPLPDVARIGEHVASALVGAHRAGIVHRDVKPGNVLIDATGTAKITDFGISRAAGDLTLTQTGLIGGTPAYLAPELARGADPTPSSDVFGLGATLYHAIEGQPPYGNNTNQLALLYTAANGNVIPPQHAGSATALLMSLLRADQGERPSMLEARDRLAALPSNGALAASTLVSPPVSASGGRQPAVASGQPSASASAEAPPWQRLGAELATPTAGSALPGEPAGPTPTSTFDSAAPAADATPPPSARRSSGKRKAGLAGGVSVAVVVVAALVYFFLSSGDTSPEQPDTTPPLAAAPPPQPEPSTPLLGQAPSSGKVQFQPAGQRVVDYYSFPDGAAASWNMLTPAAQRVFGDRQRFQQYWSQFDGVYSAGATGAFNPDGSVNISLTVTYGDSKAAKTVRVVNSGGTLLIDSDTRR